MIRVTRGDILDSQNGFNAIMKTQLPITTAYRINRIAKQVEAEFQETQQIRHSILEKYAQRNENGEIASDPKTGYALIVPEQVEIFRQEIAQLMSEFCEIPGDAIEIGLLGDIAMSAQELASIEPFLIME